MNSEHWKTFFPNALHTLHVVHSCTHVKRRTANRGIYICLQASDTEIAFVLRLVILVSGVLATFAAVVLHSPNALWFMSSDLVFVTIFPQLFCVLHYTTATNAYGSVVGFCFGTLAFVMCGIKVLDLPPVVRLPLYDEARGQLFPYRTSCMVISLASNVMASRLFR